MKDPKNFIGIDGDVPTQRKKMNKRPIISGSKMAAEERGIVYFSNVPQGFYENEMRKFFSQFGTVTNIKVGRSRKTGNARGYAFVEFRYEEVAKIVAETMNNYLMFERLMKCKLVPKEKVRPSIFKGKIDPSKPPGKKARQTAKKQVNALRDERQELRRRRKQFASLQRASKKLKQFGVDLNIQLPEIVQEKEERAKRLKSQGRTPVMAVDDSDLDITLKTPPNVRKVKSRSGSVNVGSSNATPLSRKITESTLAKKLSRTPVAQEGAVAKKKNQLFPKSVTPKLTPMKKAISKSATKTKNVKSTNVSLKKRKSLS